MVWQKAKTGKSPGYHSYTNDDMKRVNWCMNKGDWKRDPDVYEHEEAMKKMYEYYKYYYDKYNKQ